MEIHSVQDYITLLEKLKELYTYDEPIATNPIFGKRTYIPDFIYRGHGRKDYKLLPGVLRTKNLPTGELVTEYSKMEYNILNDFISEACRFIQNVSDEDTLSWLEIAQHFGTPTRLLDFTENPLVALYFACCEAKQEEACVWIIDKVGYFKELHHIKTAVLEMESRARIQDILYTQIIARDANVMSNDCGDYPWIYKPHYREERMNMQASIFMLWGYDRRALTAMLEPDNYIKDKDVDNKGCGFIGCIDIPAKYKGLILKQLAICGISEKYIYPGIDGAGKYVKEKYSYHG